MLVMPMSLLHPQYIGITHEPMSDVARDPRQRRNLIHVGITLTIAREFQV